VVGGPLGSSVFFLAVFRVNFVTLLRWRWFICIFSQIWRYSKHESIKSKAPFHIGGNCGDSGLLFLSFGFFLAILVF
jgi:hypothetical protein